MTIGKCPICGKEAKMFKHPANGCGLANQVKSDKPHEHWFGTVCWHEWVDENEHPNKREVK